MNCEPIIVHPPGFVNPKIQKLKHADIVVACPGRLIDHIGRRSIELSQLEVLVIDEADQ